MKMENREMEIKNSLVSSFVASLQPIIGRYRKIEDENVIEHFAIRVEAERERMNKKFQALLSNPDYADFGHELHIAQHQINQYADSEIARAKASGTVEFDTLTSALRDTGRGLANAVNKLEGKGSK
jgi:hypothetical protein